MIFHATELVILKDIKKYQDVSTTSTKDKRNKLKNESKLIIDYVPVTNFKVGKI